MVADYQPTSLTVVVPSANLKSVLQTVENLVLKLITQILDWY